MSSEKYSNHSYLPHCGLSEKKSELQRQWSIIECHKYSRVLVWTRILFIDDISLCFSWSIEVEKNVHLETSWQQLLEYWGTRILSKFLSLLFASFSCLTERQTWWSGDRSISDEMSHTLRPRTSNFLITFLSYSWKMVSPAEYQDTVLMINAVSSYLVYLVLALQNRTWQRKLYQVFAVASLELASTMRVL